MSKAGGKTRRKGRGKQDDEKEKLAFKVLSADNTNKLAEITDVDLLQDALVEILDLSTHSTDLKHGVTVDYYVAAVWWAKEQGYNQEQISAMYTVVHTLLENIKEKQMSLIDNLKEFKKMLVGIGVEPNPDFPVKIISGGLDSVFDVSQSQILVEYLSTSFFQHYKLFEFTYSHNQAEEIIGTDLVVDVPLPCTTPWPPPLDEGLPEALYKQHVATPPPTPPQEAGEHGEETGPGDVDGEDSLADTQREADLLAQLTPEQISDIMESVFTEMLGGLETEVAGKLRDKENAYIGRINKIHKVAE